LIEQLVEAEVYVGTTM